MIINRIKLLAKKIRYPDSYCSDVYVENLRKRGCKIGDGTYIFSSWLRPIDPTRLPFIEIGRNCKITKGVTILAHDYSYSVLRKPYHNMLQQSSITRIGDNVFLGNNVIVLMGVTIGNNVIVGAGSVVSRDIPDNCVAAGNPAKVIRSLEDHYQILSKNFISSALIYYSRLKSFYGYDPDECEMGWYSSLWRSENHLNIFGSLKMSGEDKEQVIKDMLNVEPIYGSYEKFKEVANEYWRKDTGCA